MQLIKNKIYDSSTWHSLNASKRKNYPSFSSKRKDISCEKKTTYCTEGKLEFILEYFRNWYSVYVPSLHHTFTALVSFCFALARRWCRKLVWVCFSNQTKLFVCNAMPQRTYTGHHFVFYIIKYKRKIENFLNALLSWRYINIYVKKKEIFPEARI